MVCIINTLITQTVMTKKLLVPLQAVAVIYITINFCQTMVAGEPVYDFMPWDPVVQTAGLAFIMLVGFSIFYIVLCKVDEKIKLPFSEK